MLEKKRSKNILIILSIFIVVLIGVLCFIFLNKETVETSKENVTQPVITAEQPVDNPSPPTEALSPKPSREETTALVDDSLLQQPIPEDSALIKDEIAQLTDIQSQLKEQKHILEQQHQDADELIKLKEQHLADLEKLASEQ